MQSVHVSVAGMTCQHCVATVKKAVQRVPGVIQAEVSLANGGYAQVQAEAVTDLRA